MKSLGKSFQLAATALASVIALTACGGSDGGTPTPTATPGAAVSQGVITAHGSVFVNGIEFKTTGAAITIDDAPGVEGDLKIGMIVKVQGANDDATKTGTAIKIEAHDALEGTITAVGLPNTPAANTITVMGQTVAIEDNVTRLNDDAANPLKTFAAANFVLGERVEVHAFADDQGGLRATRVVKKTTTGEFEIKGFVTSTGATFGLALTPGGAAVLNVTGTLPAGAVVGSFVEVKATTAPAAPVAPATVKTITATLVQLEDNNLGAENEKVEVEGIVAANGTLANFVINGQKVSTDPSTVFEGGVKADFAPGVKVEAEGPLKNGVIVATKISFRSNIRIEAVASGVTASGLTLLGKQITINKFTRMDDGLPLNTNHVQVRAMLDRDGNLVATRIRIITSGNPKTFLQGPVSVTAGAMTILSVPIVTDAATQFRISTDSTEAAVTKDVFFAKVKTNVTVVKVRWASSNTALPVEEAEIELGKL